MTTISGADVERVQELGESLHDGGTSIAAVRSRLDGVLPALAWTGPDRERFADDWRGLFSPALARVADALASVAQRARGHADEQQQASAAGGTGGGAQTGAPTSAAPDAAAAGAERVGRPTGELSARYESRGDAGTVSTGRGDPGGISYGTYQLSTTRGTAAEFVTWAEDRYPQAHERLDGLTPGTPAFGQAWRELAASDPAGFGAAQHAFIVDSHFQPGLERITARVPEFTLEGRSDVVADVVWSTTVQHGAGGAGTVFANALRGQDVATMSDADLIRAVYAERGRDDGMAHFRGSDPENRAGVVDRFVAEQADALSQLGTD